MAGMNRVVLVGRMVRDPERKRTNSGSSVTSFTTGAERSASFIPCTCWNKTAENVAKYCTKGSLIGVDGRLNQRSYEDRNKQKRSVIEVVAESVQFLERKGASDAASSDYAPIVNQDIQDSNSNASHEGIDSSDDDLPF